MREDFKDYLLSRHLPLWDDGHQRYGKMRKFTKTHNRLENYEPYFEKWSDEEMANIGYTMCCQIDLMMNGYLKTLEERFKTEGGMKERMYRVRTGYREKQDSYLRTLETENATLKQQLTEALEANQKWQAAYEELNKSCKDLKQRALSAYNKQQEEIEELKKTIGRLKEQEDARGE